MVCASGWRGRECGRGRAGERPVPAAGSAQRSPTPKRSNEGCSMSVRQAASERGCASLKASTFKGFRGGESLRNHDAHAVADYRPAVRQRGNRAPRGARRSGHAESLATNPMTPSRPSGADHPTEPMLHEFISDGYVPIVPQRALDRASSGFSAAFAHGLGRSCEQATTP